MILFRRSPVRLNFGREPFVFDIIGFELEEFTRTGKVKNITRLNAKFFAQIRLQESVQSTYLRSSDASVQSCAIIRQKITIHPALKGSSRYTFNSLNESSLFLSPRILKNTRFLLDLMYRENLRANGFVDESGQPLERIITSWLEGPLDSDDDIGLDFEDDYNSDEDLDEGAF